jgi:hypothetical protein
MFTRMRHFRIAILFSIFCGSTLGMASGTANAETVTDGLTVFYSPTSITIDSSGDFGYSVAGTQGDTRAVVVAKYSLNPLQLIASTSDRIEFFGKLVITPDSNTGYVIGNRTNVLSVGCGCTVSSSTIYKLNLSTMAISGSQTFPLAIQEISLDSTAQFIYFSSGLKIVKIRSSDWTEVASYTASGDARYIGFSKLRINPTNGDVLTIFYSASLVGSVISPATYELQTFSQDLSGRESLAPLGRKPWDMEISRTGSFAIVTDYLDRTASRIDLDTNETTVIDLYRRYGSLLGEYMVAISPDERFALIGGSGSIDRINLETNTHGSLTAFPMGKIVFMPSGNKALGLYVGPTYAERAKVHVLTVSELDQQTIETPFLPSELKVMQGQIPLTATASSGKQVQYFSETPSICSVDGSTLRFVGIGTCSVRASQSGGQGWAAAPDVTNSMNVIRNRISFSNLGNFGLTSNSVAVQVRSDEGPQVSVRSETPTICEIRERRIYPLKVGKCQLVASEDQIAIGARALEVSQSVWIMPDQEVGVSVNAGKNFTNTKNVKLNLVWPDGATSVRISNDGGFSSSSTRTSNLDLEIPWVLSSSTSSKATRVVYVRFSGSGIDQTRTYSDDIDLDVVNPRISSVTAASASGSIKLRIRATDNLSKISKIIVNSRKSASGQITLPFASNVTVKGNKKNLWIRVQDGAGNLSEWRKI